MKKIVMILMIAFTMMITVFAEVRLLPKDILNNYSSTCGVQLQIGYVVDSWEEVYKKTGIGKYGWEEKNSIYCDVIRPCYVIVKVSTSNGDLGWACFEYPGDGSATLYAADIE